MNREEWRPMEDAPKDQNILLLIETTTGGYHVEIGKYDEVEGGFYTSSELWPVQIDPVGWQPIIPVEVKIYLPWIICCAVSFVVLIVLAIIAPTVE